MIQINLRNPPIAIPIIALIRLQSVICNSKNKIIIFFSPIASIINILIIQFCYHCVFPKKLKVGSNFCIPHPFGIIVTPHAVIGKNVKIMQFVTIGINETSPCSEKEIIIEDEVYIGAGAKIIGNRIRIGKGAIIGAGAVVVRDVPCHTVVAGVPAKKINVLSVSPGMIERSFN